VDEHRNVNNQDQQAALPEEERLARDPKFEEPRKEQLIEWGRDHYKAQIDFFKHMMTISAAAIVAATALTGSLYEDKSDVAGASFSFSSLLMLSLSLVVANYGLTKASHRLTAYSWGKVLYDLDAVHWTGPVKTQEVFFRLRWAAASFFHGDNRFCTWFLPYQVDGLAQNPAVPPMPYSLSA
jgi:hypothetical protein